jgi:hypothetical protein
MEAWEQVQLPYYEKTAGHSALPEIAEGIAIWAPARVTLRQPAPRVPLFGLVRLGQKALEELGIEDRHPLRATVVGAIIGLANQPFVGRAVLQAPLLPAPPGSVVTEYFAVDLLECTGAAGPGTYFAFASLGGFVAQPVKIEVVTASR